MEREMIAPCGMNCAVCIHHCGIKNAADGSQPPHCQKCFYRNCDKRKGERCSACPDFPCPRLKAFDKRCKKYGISLLGNLKEIESAGMEVFLEKEAKRWNGPHCGGAVSPHWDACLSCNAKWKAD